MAVSEGFENIHWAASALLSSIFKQQLPVFPHLAISEDTEEEEEDEDQDYSFPISSILEW
jgi:hypothetical protein